MPLWNQKKRKVDSCFGYKKTKMLKVVVFLLQMRAQQLIFRVVRAGWLVISRLLALRNFFLNAVLAVNADELHAQF